MSCTIIDPDIITLNGGTKAFGGVISKATVNFGLLAGATTASVTVVQDGDTALSTPSRGENFTLTIMGLDLIFRIKGYKLDDSATGATSLTLNLSDTSHVYLDQNFIALKEEWPSGQSQANVDVIGTKMGTLPNDILAEMGFVTPDSDTVWGDLRKYFTDLQRTLAAFPFAPIQLTDTQVNYQVTQTSGKTIWGTNTDPTENNGPTLKDVIEDVIQGDLPDGTFDFSGSYREVLVQIANSLGKVAYWDLTTEKAVIEDSINSAGGIAKLGTITSTCDVVSTSESSDYSSAMAVGAVCSFASNYPGESQKTQGGSMSRYYKADSISPDFYYTPCKDTGKADKILELDLTDADVQKAIASAFDDKVYAMYALQSILKAQEEKWTAEDTLEELSLPGLDNENLVAKTVWKDALIKDDDAAKYSGNTLLESFYAQDADKKFVCVGNIYPVKFTQTDNNILAALKPVTGLGGKIGWNANEDAAPFTIGGEFTGKFAGGFGFSKGIMFVRNEDNLQSILGEGGFNTGIDVFQQYLKAIGTFADRYYVIRDGTNLRSARDAQGFNYGFYISSDNTSSSLNWKVEAGYELKSVNPYISVRDCGIEEIKSLYMACQAMMNNEGDCDMDEITVIDWINVLKRNQLKEFFTNPVPFRRSGNKLTTGQKSSDEENPQFQMHLVIAPAPTDFKGLFSSTKKTCWSVSEGIQSEEVPSAAGQVAEKITQLKLGGGKKAKANLLTKTLGEKNKLWVITNEDLGGQIGAFPVNSDGPSNLKCWYTVDGSSGTLSNGPGEFFLAGAKVPNKSDDIWTASINFGLSVNAADVGLQNDVFAKFAATAADEGSPYSFQNQLRMAGEIGKKLAKSTWVDTSAASSRSATVVLGKSASGLTLPSVADGLESLSISSAGGKVEVSMTIGNSFERAAKKAMYQLMASNSHLQHVSHTQVPDTFTSSVSPRFAALSKGLL